MFTLTTIAWSMWGGICRSCANDATPALKSALWTGNLNTNFRVNYHRQDIYNSHLLFDYIYDMKRTYSPLRPEDSLICHLQRTVMLTPLYTCQLQKKYKQIIRLLKGCLGPTYWKNKLLQHCRHTVVTVFKSNSIAKKPVKHWCSLTYVSFIIKIAQVLKCAKILFSEMS